LERVIYKNLRALTFEKEKFAPRHKSSKESLTVACCGIASGNHKSKLVVTGKGKKTMTVQGNQSRYSSCPLL
jgi:hypothetical protein